MKLLKKHLGLSVSCCGHLASSGCTSFALPSAAKFSSIGGGGKGLHGDKVRLRLSNGILSTGSFA